ncbi:MAG: FAD-dependent oxidoreductase [Anaerolineae bacterium]
MVAKSSVSNKAGSALIVGAGIGGMGSAQLLAQMGYKVYLLDSAPGIGGSMHLLDRTFPTDSCGLCIMLPDQPSYCPTLACGMHSNIEILSCAELESLEGEAGDFKAIVKHRPRYVSIERCNNCALCVEVCPVERPDDYEGHLHQVKAIYRPPTRAVPEAYVIDMDYCTRCGKCVAVCPTEAIDLEMAERRSEIEVGAVILSPGYQAFDARIKGEFGYGYYDNVLTSIEFERMVSLAGFTQAHLVRPSDGAAPRRVAFIQCVGSRDESIGYPYCSSVCCMYTAKQLAAAKEIVPDLQATVFFMDIRTFGKDFERYFNWVESLPGVTYRRCMVSSIKEVPKTHDLRVAFVGEDGALREEDFGMVVLSVGLAAPEGFQALASRLGVELNEFGFCVTDRFAPHKTTRPGVFVGGAFREPKDIPETVIEAAGVAGEAAKQVAGRRSQVAGGKSQVAGEQGSKGAGEVLPERDVSDEEPRVGAFVCTCRGEVSEVVDVGAVAEYAGQLDDVVLVKVVEDACGADLAAVQEAIEEQGLNRVVIAGCSQRLYQPEFAALLRQVGLNPNLLERADIREGVAWVHRDLPEQATAKAKAAVEMAVTRAAFQYPVSSTQYPVRRRGLVIGGGLAGLTAALELAELGFEVDLVERGEELGGNLRTAYYTLEGGKPQELLRSLIERVEANELVKVYLNTKVKELRGSKGNFLTTLALADGSDEVLEHGAIIVATGAQLATTTEYLYGQHDRVLTQKELEELLVNWETGKSVNWETGKLVDWEGLPDLPIYQSTNLPIYQSTSLPKSVVMIQCVGSRDETRPYCSRVCCSHAIKNALKLKELNPETRVFVLYREVRTYGFHELYYREARDKGVVFIRYELPDKPGVEAAGDGLRVRLTEPILGQEITLDADLLVLSTGIAPNENAALSGVLGVPLDEDGFFQEAHPKMRPLDFLKEGVFLCGLAHSPRFIDEAISQAMGAAVRAAVLLGLSRLESKDTLVQVNARLCSFCGLCVEACPYEARYLDYDERVAKVIEVLCKGCGVCAMVCPNKASAQVAFEPKQMLMAVDALMGD